ncbi:MAG: toll/interleukin-1 receptor domain-containing protein [Desulfobacterales bacterium]|nr:toll/interleukin-1 receptor domain-containing protein [Desulfobacterales bacterium]
MSKPTIFISYSYQDEEWKDRVEAHLESLKRGWTLETREDLGIITKNDLREKFEDALKNVDAVILLVSANFLTSDAIMKEEIPILLRKKVETGLQIFPLVVKPCSWEDVKWLKHLNPSPQDGKPLLYGSEYKIEANLTAFVNEIGGLIKSVSTSETVAETRISTACLPFSELELVGREQQIKILDTAWDDEKTRILTIVAGGGVGKTALVNHWLDEMEEDDYRGASHVYGWSFAGQGALEEPQVAADAFFDYALEWFGDPDPTQGLPWEKGVRLARLIRKGRTLLILDGLETLLHPDGKLEGRLKDKGLMTFLMKLSRSNPGLCVITTRAKVKDIENFAESSLTRVPLENLTVAAGADLLKKLNVTGPSDEIQAAAEEFDGHALALNLLARYLNEVHGGDVRKRLHVPKPSEEERDGMHARRVLEAYDIRIAGRPELNILYMLGLFDRPVSDGAFKALRAAPPIEGLTTALTGFSLADWENTLENLGDPLLVSIKEYEDPDIDGYLLDCHPLIREFFGEKLKNGNPVAWKKAHARLYKYYSDLPDKLLPVTLKEMEPLFAAAAHGCQAGMHHEALDDVYWERISRKVDSYLLKRLGGFGSDLTVLSGFFDTPWSAPAAALSEEAKAAVLNWASFDLRALRRLGEAAQPMIAALEIVIDQENWVEAANDASNLGQFYLSLGEVALAVEYARKGQRFADKSGDAFHKEARRVDLADALHQYGHFSEAERLFHEAEDMQEERQPEYPFLYSLRGYWFCDLLLSQGKWVEVQKRASQSLKSSKKNPVPLDAALDNLTLGNAHLLQALEEGSRVPAIVGRHLNEAVAGLREVGALDYLPRALLARAALNRVRQEFNRAWADLEEVQEIADHGAMGIHMAEYHLEAARLHLARNEVEETRENFNKAEKMIGEMGYHRRDREREDLHQILGG